MMNARENKPSCYQIIVEGHLDVRWQAWFEDLTITPTDDGNTMLHGFLVDQAALHGVLKRVNNLGLTLISVNSHM